MATDSPAVLLVANDLFLGSRIQGAVEQQGARLTTAPSGPAAVALLASGHSFQLILLDLQTPGLDIKALVAARSEADPPIIAYGPHVHDRLLESARTHGCEQVLTRGQFDATLHDLLRQQLT